jgi:hypothetical protein
MFVDKETKRQAQALADKVKEMSLEEDAHPRQAQWLYDLGLLLDQLS